MNSRRTRTATGSRPTNRPSFDELLRPFRSPWRDPAKALPAGRADRRPPAHAGRAAQHHLIYPGQRPGLRSRQKYRANLDDLILLRSDGTPTYMLAVVVDDHDMGVTQVIRGDDHLTNTFRQIPIFDGMGWDRPAYAHVPLIHGPDGKKLSKRHGAQAVHEYRDMGYLPEGPEELPAAPGLEPWRRRDHPDEPQAIEWFDVDGLNKAPARLDLRQAGLGQRPLHGAGRRRPPGRPVLRPPGSRRPARRRENPHRGAAMPHLKTRAATIAALADASRFLGELRPIQLDREKPPSQMTPEGKARLQPLSLPALKPCRDFSEPR